VELGDAYHIKGNHKREAELFTEALQMRPDYPAIISRQARCALSLGDTIKAEGFITKLLTSYRGYNEVQTTRILGDLYHSVNLPEKAEQYYRMALKLGTKNPFDLNNLAWLLVKEDINVEEGLSLVNQALVKDPDNYIYQYTKGVGLFKQGYSAEALELLEKSWAQRPNYDYDHYQVIQEVKKAVARQK